MNGRRSVLSLVPPDFLKSMLISPVTAQAPSQSCCYYTLRCIWMARNWFLVGDSASVLYMTKEDRQELVVVDLLQIKLACSGCVCVCMVSLIRGLERYREAACPPSSSAYPLPLFSGYSRLSSLLSVSIRFSSARLLPQRLCPLRPARTSLPDCCCHWVPPCRKPLNPRENLITLHRQPRRPEETEKGKNHTHVRSI